MPVQKWHTCNLACLWYEHKYAVTGYTYVLRVAAMARRRNVWKTVPSKLQEQSPLLGRKSTAREGPRVNWLRSQWQNEVKLENTITMLTQIVRLLHDLVVNIIRNPAAVAARPQLTSAVDPSQGVHCLNCAWLW